MQGDQKIVIQELAELACTMPDPAELDDGDSTSASITHLSFSDVITVKMLRFSSDGETFYDQKAQLGQTTRFEP